MTYEATIGEILEELLKSDADITRAIVITARGVVAREIPRLYSLGVLNLIDSPTSLSKPEFALFASALVNLAHNLTIKDTLENLETIYTSSADDLIHKTLSMSMMKVGSKAILTVVTKVDAKIGYIWIETKKACKKIEKVIHRTTLTS